MKTPEVPEFASLLERKLAAMVPVADPPPLDRILYDVAYAAGQTNAKRRRRLGWVGLGLFCALLATSLAVQRGMHQRAFTRAQQETLMLRRELDHLTINDAVVSRLESTGDFRPRPVRSSARELGTDSRFTYRRLLDHVLRGAEAGPVGHESSAGPIPWAATAPSSATGDMSPFRRLPMQQRWLSINTSAVGDAS